MRHTISITYREPDTHITRLRADCTCGWWIERSMPHGHVKETTDFKDACHAHVRKYERITKNSANAP